MEPLLQTDERLIWHMRASHLTESMHMKGLLWLTNQRIIFFTHHLNARQYQIDWPIITIQEIQLVNHFFIFPYGLIFTLTDGTTQHLAVWRRHRLKQQIKNLINKANDSKI